MCAVSMATCMSEGSAIRSAIARRCGPWGCGCSHRGSVHYPPPMRAHVVVTGTWGGVELQRRHQKLLVLWAHPR